MRKFLAFLFSLIFIVVASAALILNAAESILFDPDAIKDQLREHGVYELVLNEAARELLNQGSEITGEEFFITPEEIVEAVRSVITPSWLQEQTKFLIDRVYVWLDTPQGDIRNAGLTVAFGDIISRASSIVSTTVQERFNELPLCLPSQLAGQDGEALITQGVCRPEGFRVDDFFSQSEVDALFEQLPKEVNLTDLSTADNAQAEETLDRANNYRDRVYSARQALQTLFVISLLLILLVGALAATSAKAFFGWVGVPLFIVGVVLIVPSVIIQQDAVTLVNAQLESISLSGNLGATAKEIILDMIDTFVNMVRTRGIVLSSLGFAFILTAFFIPKKKVKEKKGHGEPKQMMSLQEKFRGIASQ